MAGRKKQHPVVKIMEYFHGLSIDNKHTALAFMVAEVNPEKATNPRKVKASADKEKV